MFFSFFLCLVSALLLILSFPPAEFSFFAWISLIPLFLALKNKNIKCAFWLSYFWGLIFWGCLLSWLTKVTFLGYIFLVLYLAIYSGILGIFIACHFLIIIPFLWVILEYLRTHLFTGFGWALLGYSQYKNLPLIQIADITGAYGVSFLIVLVNLVIYLRVSSSVGPKKKKSFSTFFSLLFSTLFLLSL
ncbi:MAG: apolipoprotein N-acyltransferase, partial [Candidatus Omnitrophica bacterium]|nr:apolipoprotein N-acyltransferase [Candidatus Omnitrophota bacterium]